MRTSTKATIKLRATRKERAVLWAIACWFPDNIVSSQLKQQLYPGNMVARLAKEYDNDIQRRIIDLGAAFEWRRKEKSNE